MCLRANDISPHTHTKLLIRFLSDDFSFSGEGLFQSWEMQLQKGRIIQPLDTSLIKS